MLKGALCFLLNPVTKLPYMKNRNSLNKAFGTFSKSPVTKVKKFGMGNARILRSLAQVIGEVRGAEKAAETVAKTASKTGKAAETVAKPVSKTGKVAKMTAAPPKVAKASRTAVTPRKAVDTAAKGTASAPMQMELQLGGSAPAAKLSTANAYTAQRQMDQLGARVAGGGGSATGTRSLSRTSSGGQELALRPKQELALRPKQELAVRREQALQGYSSPIRQARGSVVEATSPQKLLKGSAETGNKFRLPGTGKLGPAIVAATLYPASRLGDDNGRGASVASAQGPRPGGSSPAKLTGQTAQTSSSKTQNAPDWEAIFKRQTGTAYDPKSRMDQLNMSSLKSTGKPYPGINSLRWKPTLSKKQWNAGPGKKKV